MSARSYHATNFDQRVLHAGLTFAYGFCRAVKFEHADLRDIGRDQYVGRVTGQSAASNSILKYVDGDCDRIEKARRVDQFVKLVAHYRTPEKSER